MSSLALSTILYLIAVISYLNGYRNEIRPRVFGGVNDTRNEFPFVVSLEGVYNSVPVSLCTGSLITETWIITAAHCFLPSLSLVRYGDMTLPSSKTKSYRNILQKIPHPSFMELKAKKGRQRQLMRNDIALVLSEKIPIEQHGRLSAVDYQTLMGLAVRYAGFGLTFGKIDNKEAFEVEIKKWIKSPLQVGDAAVVTCDEELLSNNNGPFICLAAPCAKRKHQILPGDSGGPLSVANKIVGVASVASTEPDAPITLMGFTPVSPYLTWIRDVVSKNNAL